MCHEFRNLHWAVNDYDRHNRTGPETATRLAITAHAECNIVLVLEKTGPYLQAVDTPKASRVFHILEGYNIWKWQTRRGIRRFDLSETNVSADRAAEILVGEYLHAKAKRVKKLYPDHSEKSPKRCRRLPRQTAGEAH